MTVQILICLRDQSSSPCDMVVEIEKTFDDEADLNDTEREEGAFEEFICEVRRISPERSNLDVYIGWWGNQSTFVIPLDFFRLIVEQNWPVTFDIND